MRKINFRGKRTDNGEWIEGYLFCIWNEAYILWGTTNGIPNMVEVIPETVGQFTGLTDKNGEKIFEGDILKSELFNDVGVVVSNERNCSCCDGVFGYRFDGGGDLRDYKTYEVAGNIHDNPELLK